MKKLKRVLAVLLTAIMTLAMATTAFAAAPKGSLTVKVNAKNTLEGQTIKVYKLFGLTVSKATSYNYEVNETYKTMIAKALGLQEDSTSEKLYEKLQSLGIDVLYDDRDERPGVMFADMELMGIPHIITIGDKSLKDGNIEYKLRRTGEREMLPLDTALETLLKKLGR